MSTSSRALASILTVSFALVAHAQEAPEPTEPEAVPAEEQVAADESLPEVEVPAAPAPVGPAHVVQLGPTGYDADGRAGRVHTVARGDTLWDISDAYLGTPWAWPSIWGDNEEVTNPHLIHPGDLLWITPSEIRRVSADEADALLAGTPGAASLDDATYDALPDGALEPVMFRYSSRDSAGLVAEETLNGAATLVETTGERIWLGSMDQVYLGLGVGEVDRGDQFVVFRNATQVYNPSTGAGIGWHVKALGWVEVLEVYEETSLAEVRMAFEEMELGDRVLPRERFPLEVELRPTSDGIDGQVVWMPHDRLHNGTDDIVYLDRGTEDGLEVGNVVEVYREQGRVVEPAKPRKVQIAGSSLPSDLAEKVGTMLGGSSVQVPPLVIGKVVVVGATANTATGVLKHATTEVQIGDRFRPGVLD